MLEHIFEGQPDDPGELDDMDADVVERFKDEYRRWLADGSNTPFSTIIRWMSYGKGHRRREGGAARIMWEEGGEALRYLGQRIELREFRNAVRAGVREAEDLLDGLFFGGWADARASIDAARLVDSMVYEGPGRSFETNGKNEWLRPGYRRVAELARGALWDARAGGWRRDRVTKYLAQLQDFKRAHLQLFRNVFVFDGQVLLVTDRDKNKAIRGIGRKVARFLPEHVGKMMVAYVAWLLPFERMLAARPGAAVAGDAETRGLSASASASASALASLDEWLWKDGRKGRWDTAELSKQLASATGRHVGVELTVADYRHVAIELGRKIRGLVLQQLEVDIGADDDGGGGQAADGERGGAGYEDALQPQMIANYREISRLWHQYLNLDGGGGVAAAATAVPKTGKSRKRPVAGAAGVGGSGNGDGDSSSQHDGGRHKKQKTAAAGPGNSSNGSDGDGDGSCVDVDAGLRRLFGQEARWRSGEQRDGMAKIMALQGGQVLIVILPTGGGKSIFFMLPPAVERLGTTVMVVPFVALIDDLVERARAFGVDCIQWQPAARTGRDEPLREARLLVVSADLAGGDEFMAGCTASTGP
ncbi:hypothetical protein DL771_011450 [Monosporascus sp. 5C6A]|nr:hypothetical protein DL771_011450 [Monosporascus sp. 5C6A]